MTDANSPEAKMIEAMYGSGFEYRWAIVNGLFVCRISNDPNAVYKLIDQAKAGTPAQVCSEMQKAMSVIPDADGKDAIVTYNYLRLMKMMQAFAPMPFTMPDVPSKSNLVFAAKIDNGSFALDFDIPSLLIQPPFILIPIITTVTAAIVKIMCCRRPVIRPPALELLCLCLWIAPQ